MTAIHSWSQSAFLPKTGRALLGIGVLILAGTSSACSKDSGSSVTVELKSAARPSLQQQLRSTPLFDNGFSPRGASDQTSGITLESIRMNIYDIGLSADDMLSGGGNSRALYRCEGDCEIELMGDELSNLLTKGSNSGSLDSGQTYASVMIATCPYTSQSFKVKVKASAQLGGTTYYTQSGSPYMTSNSASYGYAEIEYNTCRTYTVFSKPIVYDGSATTVNLFIDLRSMVQVYHPSSSLYTMARNGMPECTSGRQSAPNGSGPILCMALPEVAGTLQSQAPTIERYRLVDSNTATAAPSLLGLYIDSSGAVVGGYLRPLIDGVTTQSGFIQAPGTFKKGFMTGSAVGWTDYSGGATVSNQASTNGNFTVLDFPRPAVGAAAQSLTSVVDGAGAPVAGVNFSVTRVD